jgi:hypothetical protein
MLRESGASSSHRPRGRHCAPIKVRWLLDCPPARAMTMGRSQRPECIGSKGSIQFRGVMLRESGASSSHRPRGPHCVPIKVRWLLDCPPAQAMTIGRSQRPECIGSQGSIQFRDVMLGESGAPSSHRPRGGRCTPIKVRWIARRRGHNTAEGHLTCLTSPTTWRGDRASAICRCRRRAGSHRCAGCRRRGPPG